MDKKKRTELAVIIGVPVLLVIMYVFREQILWVGSRLGPCWIHELTGYHCPGCGNTRAIKALLHFKPITAMRNNPTIPLLCFFGIEYYLELAFDLCGKQIKLVPRKWQFWLGVLIVIISFLVLRNFIPVLAPIPETVS